MSDGVLGFTLDGQFAEGVLQTPRAIGGQSWIRTSAFREPAV